MDVQTRKYRQAAVTYLIYGVIYLLGAMYLADAGLTSRSADAGAVWWFTVGALMVVAFPIFIWKQFKWMTRVLAVLVSFRIIGLVRILAEKPDGTVPLPLGAEMPMVVGTILFLLVAIATAFMLVRAGWEWDRMEIRSPRASR